MEPDSDNVKAPHYPMTSAPVFPGRQPGSQRIATSSGFEVPLVGTSGHPQTSRSSGTASNGHSTGTSPLRFRPVPPTILH